MHGRIGPVWSRVPAIAHHYICPYQYGLRPSAIMNGGMGLAPCDRMTLNP
jgi:hypothetical protein